MENLVAKLTVTETYDNSVRVLMEKPSVIPGVPNRTSCFMPSDGSLQKEQVIEVPAGVTIKERVSTESNPDGTVASFIWLSFE